MKKHTGIVSAFVMISILASLCGCAKANEQSSSSALPPPVSSAPSVATSSSAPDAPQSTADTLGFASGEVVVTFDYEKQSGTASNQFAVWIEDADGGFVKTLYATKFTANGGYKNRPDSIPAWVEKSGLAEMTKAEVDAIAGATPKAGTLSYKWDMTDANGNAVPPGRYLFFVEGSLRWKNRVLYSGVIEIGGASVTAQADAQFFYEANGNQPALSDASPESAMIGAVTASFIDAGGMVSEYRKITPEKAKEMIDGGNIVILDVRTESEFEEAHIAGAILLPDYDIEALAPGALLDKDRTILVYCRSGRRSEATAKALAGMGYTNVYDFGGIIDWPYETTSGK